MMPIIRKKEPNNAFFEYISLKKHDIIKFDIFIIKFIL